MKRWLRRTLLILLTLAIAGGIVFALMPRPVEVETGEVARGPMRVVVDEDGRTRIKERYLVTAPLAGRAGRITLKPGAAVQAGKTVLVQIEPSDPSLLDPRARAEAEAKVKGAAAALDQAGAGLLRAGAALEKAQLELRRQRELAERGAGKQLELEDAVTMEAMLSAELKAAQFARDIARFELEQARAALSRTDPAAAGGAEEWRFDVTAPITGAVLRVLNESGGVVTPGTPLVEVGDTHDLEVEVDVLSTDGVAIRPGAAVSIEHWGGERPLRGTVRLVEPAAFMKISALGVEEQRVNVVIDLLDPPEERVGLGDAFRIEAKITVWEQDDAVKTPASALFRNERSWAVFVVDQGVARIREVEIGRRNTEEAQVLSGLSVGERVILYPGDRVRDGARVSRRDAR